MTQHPGLSRWGRWYVGIVIAAGVVAIAAALNVLVRGQIDARWWIFVCLTLVSASFAIKVPGVPARISVSETFVFASVLLFGTAAGVLTVALDGIVASLWIRRGKPYALHKTVFNAAAPALALTLAAWMFFGQTGIPPFVVRPTPVQQLLPLFFVFAAIYFALNSWLTAVAIGSETGAQPDRIWIDNFLWMAINFFGGASVSVLVLLLFDTAVGRSTIVGIIIPLLTVIYLVVKIVIRRKEDARQHLTELKRADDERVRLEAELRDAHDMESVGRLAAGVAHDFGSLVEAIIGSADELLADTSNPAHRIELQRIRNAAEMARDLARRLPQARGGPYRG